MNLKKKLRNFGVGSIMTLASLVPSFGQENADSIKQTTSTSTEAYFKASVSVKSFNNSFVQDYLDGGPFGAKIGLEFYSGNNKRFGISGGRFSKKNEKIGTKFSNIEFVAYYDLVLRLTEETNLYLGAGGKVENWRFDIKNEPSVTTSGFGYGLRIGIENFLDENFGWYAEANYNSVDGEIDGENISMSGTQVTAGIKINF